MTSQICQSCVRLVQQNAQLMADFDKLKVIFSHQLLFDKLHLVFLSNLYRMTNILFCYNDSSFYCLGKDVTVKAMESPAVTWLDGR